MTSSTTAQFLLSGYGADLVDTAIPLINTTLSIVAAFTQTAASIAIFLIGKNLALGSDSFNHAATYMSRMVVVFFLMMPAHFNEYITTNATKTIPQQITSTLTGNSNTSVAQAFDSEHDAIDLLESKILAQAPWPVFMIERGIIHIVAWTAHICLHMTELVYGIVNTVIPFMLPLGAVLLIFFIFDATANFAMRWVGKVISLFMVMFLTVQLGAYIARMDGKYLQQYGTVLQATSAASDFSMNAGDQTFSAIGMSEFGNVTNSPASATNTQSTLNVTAGLNMLGEVVCVLLYGWLCLTLVSGFAIAIGSTTGSILAPIGALAAAGTKAAFRR